jgi:hypothetical protein
MRSARHQWPGMQAMADAPALAARKGRGHRNAVARGSARAARGEQWNGSDQMKGNTPTRRHRRTRERPAGRQPVGQWWIMGVVVAAAAAVGGLLLLGPVRSETAASARIAEARVKGDPSAPVTIDEWGDFQ